MDGDRARPGAGRLVSTGKFGGTGKLGGKPGGWPGAGAFAGRGLPLLAVSALRVLVTALAVRTFAYGMLFSPQDALIWVTPGATYGLAVGALAALAQGQSEPSVGAEGDGAGYPRHQRARP